LVITISNAIEDVFIPQINWLERQLMKVGYARAPLENIRILRETYNKMELLQGTSALDFINKIIDDGERDLTTGFGFVGQKISRIGNSKIFMRHGGALIRFMNNDLKKVTADAFEHALKARQEDQKFLETIHDMGASEVVKRIFGSEKYLPAIERSDVAITKRGNHIYFNRSEENARGIPTGAEVIGRAMMVVPDRIETQKKFEGVEPTDRKQHGLIFSEINKILRIVGHPYEEGAEDIEPYFQSVDSAGRFDIYSYYDKEKSAGLRFAIPDDMIITEGFDFERSLNQRFLGDSSVRGRASLIRAGARMLKFYRPDQGRLFFESLGSHHFALTTSIFPIGSLFDLHLGFLASQLATLERIGTRVVNRHHETFDVSEREGATKNAIMAAVSDVVNGKPTGVIRTTDVSEMIVAVSEFLEAIEGIPPGVSQSLSEDVNGDFSKHRKLIEASDSLKKFVMGMGFYLTSKLRNSNREFVREESDLGAEVRLEDQLAAMEALQVAHKLWKSNIFANSIVDAYRAMQKRLYDVETGFFKSSSK
ncbi:MAG: hypothetical protein KDD25_10220, partial [Bdellovibrionales bacterium]|nr:hypothetical protein [Bdellovibrionales bacterium]